ncbi:arsenical resistance operon repressor-like protein [Staphylococcus aureus]|nr:arsenical resistance operon repressor-like protein [Staphylococcus aureus]
MEVIKAKTDMNEEQQLDFYENMFNALADKNRLKILNQISQSPNKSLCVCDLEELLELKQSKLSYHIKN